MRAGRTRLAESLENITFGSMFRIVGESNALPMRFRARSQAKVGLDRSGATLMHGALLQDQAISMKL